MNIYYKNEPYEVANEVTLRELAERFKADYSDPIILASVNGKLKELFHRVPNDAEIDFVTIRDKIGHKTYQRSCSMLFFAAVEKVVGKEKMRRTVLHFSIDDGFYYTIEGDVKVNAALVSAIEKKMREMVDADLPITKRSVGTDQARSIFKKQGFDDKVKLFGTRLASRVNVYSLDGYQDYYYGYMTISTGYLKNFKLYAYRDGIVLQMPNVVEPDIVHKFIPERQFFKTQIEGEAWAERQGIANIGDLNEKIIQGNMRDVILFSEALQEERIARLAAKIKAKKDVKFVMIAGPSSSGKTTFSQRLCIQLTAQGLRPHYIGVDNYFIDRALIPLDEEGNKRYEDLEAVDVELFNRHMTELLAGGTISLPRFDFITGLQVDSGEKLSLPEGDILVIEGIHCLNDDLSPRIPASSKFKVYISALTQINIDDHNRIPSSEGRLIRRIVRDHRTRGYSAADTLSMWSKVREGEEKNIFPHQEKADVFFNSALPYEAAVLKLYAQPLLFQVPRDHPEYREALHLLKFLDYFITSPLDDVPKNSILREFCGGGCFRL